MIKRKKCVVVAMSGGVDSSVAVLLLKDKGYEVIGLTMQLLPKDKEKRFGGCCSLEAIEYARKAAAKLKIKHYVLNFRDVFKKTVIDNFSKEYKEGRTPNPCIRCNQFIKFDAFLNRAKEIGADFIATGHYARIEKAEGRKEAKIRYLLKKGTDAKKDQSYALYTMTQKQLKNTLFPLGGFTKNEVLKIARRQKLPSANRKESQEICFIPDNNYPEFLRKYIKSGIKPGHILDINGNTIGRHKGLIYYTIGQRRGIGISAKMPLYVIEIDKDKNTITVAEEKYLYSKQFTAKDVCFTSINKPDSKIEAEVKIRYLHKPHKALICPKPKDSIEVIFKKPQKAITPGQAAVFYDKDIVLGGGTINEVFKDYEK